ncbi:MAG: tRNA (adenosine(37)-N6)-threonylcarbamoyltransferase complex dimerization subunit type 1 TsaB [Anaerolineales bacterium]
MLLAIDTSTSWCGLALYRAGEVIAEYTWQARTHHTLHLAPALAELLKRSGASIGELQGVAVALGPGSFTALRVGLALAKGICLVRHLPIIGIPTLNILAAAQPCLPGFDSLIVAIQAGRGRLAIGRYVRTQDRWEAIGEAQVTTLQALLETLSEPTYLCGEFTPQEREQIARHSHLYLPSPSACVRRPAVLAELGWARLQKGEAHALAALAPIYLHLHEGIA